MMKQLFVVAILIFTQSLWAAETELQVLFLGNSLTGVNNLPSQFRMMAEDNGHAPYVEAHLRFGQPLNVHLADPVVQAALTSRHWDAIVLQDYSNLILTDAAAVQAHVEAVHQLVPTARLVLAENWAYAGSPAGTQDTIDQRYRQIAAQTHAELIPLGEGFVALQKVAPNDVYLDDRHPTPLTTSMLARMYLNFFYGETYRGTLGSAETTNSIFDGEATTFHGFDLQTRYTADEVRATRDFPGRCEVLFNAF